MNDERFDGLMKSVEALTDMDDGLLSEALEERGKRRLPPYIGAAAMAVIAAGLAIALISLLGRKKPQQTAQTDINPPLGTGEPAVLTEAPGYTDPTAEATVYAPTETVLPEETGYPAPTIPPEHDTADATALPTSHGTPAPADTSEATARPTGGTAQTPQATSATTNTPTQTPLPPVIPQPTAQETNTPKPTAAPKPTATPKPTAAPEPTWPPVEGTTVPQPSGTPVDATSPPAPESITFYSLSVFISAVRNHSHPLLYGIDCYYYPMEIPEGAEVKSITVSDTDIELTFMTRDLRVCRLFWYRNESPDYLDTIVNNDPGQWYGSVYVIDRPNDTAAINAWFTQHGVVFHAVVSWQFGIETAVSFCNVRKVTI